eukprot:3578408-Ditylum_brightwellii.AAC.1
MATGRGGSVQKGRQHADPAVGATLRVTLSVVAEDTHLLSPGGDSLHPHTHKAPYTPPTRAPTQLLAGNTNLLYRKTWDALFSKD